MEMKQISEEEFPDLNNASPKEPIGSSMYPLSPEKGAYFATLYGF
jgi:hypothetical protein